MKKSNLSLLVLLLLTTTTACNFNPRIQKGLKEVPTEKTAVSSDSEPFTLQPGHPAYSPGECTVTLRKPGSLFLEFRTAGKCILVLKAKAPLIITSQKGVLARLRPGWDGTLGYSLYALEAECEKPGEAMVVIAPLPVQSGQPVTQEEFDTRKSRFPDNINAFPAWQVDYRKRLVSMMMNGGFPQRVPLAAQVVETIDRPSYVLQRVHYQTQPDRKNTLLLSIPKHVSGKVPLLIALHGHEATWGEADTGAYRAGHADDFCAYFAERGWAVLQPATMNHTLQHPGWTLQGEWTWDAMVAIDYALSLPVTDSRRISVCGLSTGGHLAMNLLALDDRVHAGVVGCVLSTWHHYRERMRIPPHCDCGISGQLGEWLEQCDWAALAAPKPVEFQHGRKDGCYCPGADSSLLDHEWNTSIMPVSEFEIMFNEVRRAYRLKGDTSCLKLFFHNEGHHVNSEAAFEFLTSANK